MKSFYQLVRHEGNRDLFKAVEMSVTALASGHPFHIHTEGLRGTGKTTILRSAAAVLPPITRIKGCLYNCDPEQPHCPEHRGLSAQEIEKIGKEEVPCPFLEISHGAKVSTIVGSIDLAKLTDPLQPMAALLPGTIPQAHRGVLFVDEINRLADTSPEIADVLLDVMGTKPGRLQIEESGLPTVEMPVRVTVWAASNPDKEPGSLSQIRKQLSDRFDLAVGMGRPSEVEAVMNILMDQSVQQVNPICGHLGIGRLNQVAIDNETRKTLAAIYVDHGLESLRAIEAMETAAKLHALLAGQVKATAGNIFQIVPLVLSHRSDPATIANILNYLRGIAAGSEPVKAEYVAGEISAEAPNLNNKSNSRYAKSRLKNWWEQLREKLSNRSDNGKRQSSPQRNSQSGLGGGSKGGQQIADPTHIDITAPPNAATPLSQLSVQEFVSADDNVRHDR